MYEVNSWHKSRRLIELINFAFILNYFIDIAIGKKNLIICCVMEESLEFGRRFLHFLIMRVVFLWRHWRFACHACRARTSADVVHFCSMRAQALHAIWRLLLAKKNVCIATFALSFVFMWCFWHFAHCCFCTAVSCWHNVLDKRGWLLCL